MLTIDFKVGYCKDDGGRYNYSSDCYIDEGMYISHKEVVLVLTSMMVMFMLMVVIVNLRRATMV